MVSDKFLLLLVVKEPKNQFKSFFWNLCQSSEEAASLPLWAFIRYEITNLSKRKLGKYTKLSYNKRKLQPVNCSGTHTFPCNNKILLVKKPQGLI